MMLYVSYTHVCFFYKAFLRDARDYLLEPLRVQMSHLPGFPSCPHKASSGALPRALSKPEQGSPCLHAREKGAPFLS